MNKVLSMFLASVIELACLSEENFLVTGANIGF